MRLVLYCLVAGLLGAASSAWTVDRLWRGRAEAAEAREADMAVKVGVGCEPVYLGLWPTVSCKKFLGLFPSECAAEVGVYRHTDIERVRARMREVGPGFGRSMWEERGARERRLPIAWDPVVRP